MKDVDNKNVECISALEYQQDYRPAVIQDYHKYRKLEAYHGIRSLCTPRPFDQN
jgi:hypothetical protein